VASFIEEARTAAKLKHALLVSVYDVQEEDGLPYIVQEYIEGENLANWFARHRPTFEQIVRVLIGVAGVLSANVQFELCASIAWFFGVWATGLLGFFRVKTVCSMPAFALRGWARR
jgi:serine/threonine protein kinase